MRDLVRRLSKAGDLGTDFCARKYCTVKTCTLREQRRKFVGCDVDTRMLSASESNFVLTLTSQALSLQLDISGSGEV